MLHVNETFLFLTAVITSWIYGVLGMRALGPSLIALVVVADEVLTNNLAWQRRPRAHEGLQLAAGMARKLLYVMAAYSAGAVLRAWS